MSVRRICYRDVHLADAEETVSVAAERMRSRGVGTLVVVNHVKVPVGIITDRDLVLRVLAPEKDPRTTLLGDVMTPYPKVIAEKAPIERAVALMREGGFRRLPVVNADGALVGIVALDDVLELLAEEFRQIHTLLERTGPRAVAATP
jgi:CBS domain-containing protein